MSNMSLSQISQSDEAAKQIIESALNALKSNNYKVALEFFEKGLQIWIDLLRSETLDQTTKSIITHNVETYIAMAENCKAEVKKIDLNQQIDSSLNTEKKSGILQNFIGWPSSKKTSNATASSGIDQNASKKKAGPIPDTYDWSRPKKISNTSESSVKSVPSSKSPMRSPRDPVRSASGRAANTTSKAESKTQKADAKLSENELQILDEMLDTSPGIRFDDIAGLSLAKQTLQEAVILPNIRPDLFTGLRAPCKGVLLFGPPGTGKTLLAKAVATESGFTFFSITASSVTSKYVGEGEKLMKTLFDLARKRQPSVIFFDEIDALMSARKESEHEASRRLKTEFMVQVDGAGTNSEDRILVMAATNTPWALDEAVLRRMSKRVYVPLPDPAARKALLTRLLKEHLGPTSRRSSENPTSSLMSTMSFGLVPGAKAGLAAADLDRIVTATEGYSGSDLAALCREAAMGPIREMSAQDLRTVSKDSLRGLIFEDFTSAIRLIRPSVSPDSLETFTQWSDSYGAK